jgi:N-methylhydantoinase B
MRIQNQQPSPLIDPEISYRAAKLHEGDLRLLRRVVRSQIFNCYEKRGTPMPRAARGEFDPVRFEVIRSALLAVVEEMGATLRRAAYSTNIKTRGDFSCAFFDSECRAVVQAFAQPSHLGSLAHIVPAAIEKYGRERLQPGDALLTNDPYTGGVHLNDITLISPVFIEDKLFGYVANIAHHVDVGGSTPGSIGVSKEIFQEGIIIPPIRFMQKGNIDPNVFDIIRANIRGEREVSGDFRAQSAANRIGASRLIELADRFGVADSIYYMGQLLEYTDRRVSSNLSTFPEGRYHAQCQFDNDGNTDEPVDLSLTVEIADGIFTVNFEACPAQRPSSLNATFSQTYSAVMYVVKCLIDHDIPVNDGLYRQIRVKTRPGTITHATYPTAVAAGWEVAMHICDLIFKALSEAMPERTIACTKGIVCNLAFGGINPTSGEYFTYYETIAGGCGATAANDGMDAVQAHFQNTENAPAEEVELYYPVRILRYELIPDSEGPGKQRGGLGIRRDFLFPGWNASFSILSDRAIFPPWGLAGGQPARAAKYILDPDGKATELSSKTTITLAPNAVISIQTPGGGGYGNPHDRDPKKVSEDLRQQRISRLRAETAYGAEKGP